jgi:RsiW-degrading membrane proteinase PrsW (M82 family)
MILYLTVLPAIIIFLYFYFSQEFKTIHSLIFQVFIIGLFIAFPAGTLNTFIIKNFSNQNPVNNALLMGFFAGGLVEELLKFSRICPERFMDMTLEKFSTIAEFCRIYIENLK